MRSELTLSFFFIFMVTKTKPCPVASGFQFESVTRPQTHCFFLHSA